MRSWWMEFLRAVLLQFNLDELFDHAVITFPQALKQACES